MPVALGRPGPGEVAQVGQEPRGWGQPGRLADDGAAEPVPQGQHMVGGQGDGGIARGGCD